MANIKIAIADNNNRKFTADIIEHWEKLGHEVEFNMGASEKLAQWADIYYVDTWDNNIHYLWKLYHGVEGVSRTEDWDNNKKPRIIVRVLDWEAWLGYVRDQAIIDWVDDIIVIAPHIETELNLHAHFGNKIHLIRPGVNLDKFPLKTKVTDGFQLGMALGDMWKYKNHMGGLDIFTSLYQKDNRWRLHVRGQHESGIFDPENWNYYLESRGIKDVVTLYPRLDNMNDFYENIDILLHPGQKEAFCYSIAEALSKGIKVVINDFLGSHDIWNIEYLFQTHQEAISKISGGTRPKPNIIYRQYIEEYYSLAKQLETYDNLFFI